MAPSGEPQTRPKGDAVEGLPPSEANPWHCLRRGLQNAAIAAQLGVSEKTVDHSVPPILRKLDVRTALQRPRKPPGWGDRPK